MKHAASKRRPLGLATRAVALIVCLLVATAIAAAGAVWFGVERENERNQLMMAERLASRVAFSVGRLTVRNGPENGVELMRALASSRSDQRLMSLTDAGGHVLMQAGETPDQVELASQMARHAIATGQRISQRSPDGLIAVSAPMVEEGRTLGAVTIVWKPQSFRFDMLLALAPFFLMLACLMLVVIPVAAYFVRRATAPLEALTRFAEKVAERGEAAPIELRTGDEFETLATAFNQMTARLDASMKRIQEIAFVDPVTQLPNHDRFQRELDFFILQAEREKRIGAVLVFELQRLPRVLQTLEPDAARDFIRLVADRITHATNAVDRAMRAQGAREDAATAARLGASEFGVLALGLASVAEAARFAQHLNAALNQPFEWRGHKLSLGATCGVALAPRDGKDADAVIRHARMALLAASAPSRLKVFTPSLDREAMARLTLEREMRGALERNEFRAYFQPKINLQTGKIEGAEALARWVRPDRTIVSPGRFIPVAEESGLIGPLSDAIMREACWKAAAWGRAGFPTKVAVNVSALQFRNDRFADHVLQIVQNSGLPASALELEITESVAMENAERALKIIQPLRAAGVRLAIDDFGCGHSSLAALSKLPFDVIKIDQQFIRALERQDAQAEAIIDMILALARALNLEVVAEGVERREHVAFMAERGCHWVQGFVYGAAVSAPEFAELLRVQAGEEILAEDAA